MSVNFTLPAGVFKLNYTLMNRTGNRNKQKFAAAIREARIAKHLSQRELGEQIGVWNTYVGQWEKGEKIPADEKIVKLAEVLELDVDELLLAAYEAKAASAEASALFKKMERALTDPVLQQLLSADEALDPSLLEALADGNIRGALQDKDWSGMLSRCYRIRKKRDIPSLLALVEAMSDKQWTAMIQMLEAMGIEVPNSPK